MTGEDAAYPPDNLPIRIMGIRHQFPPSHNDPGPHVGEPVQSLGQFSAFEVAESVGGE